MCPNFTYKFISRYSTSLVAANGSQIKTYGIVQIRIHATHRFQFSWNFLVADVTLPILGSDVLKKLHLLLDVANKQLLHNSCTIPLYDTFFFSKYDSSHLLHSTSISVYHHIETMTARPLSTKPRPLFSEKLQAAKKEFRDMELKGIIRPSNSPWASPLHMVKKPNGSFRPCGDYRRLNNVTVPDSYPLPRIQDFATNLRGCHYFSTIDLEKGYLQIPMAKEDICKTAIITPFGLYEFLKMPFGLKNAAQTFQRHMNSILGDLPFVFVYVDDILVASATQQEHEKHLLEVSRRLKRNNLKVNETKCVFRKQTLDFLGHTINEQGIKPKEDKVQAILRLDPPKSKQELQRFIGGITFYIRFLPHLATILQPLHSINNTLTRKNQLVPWTGALRQSFTATKRALAKAALLAYPAPNVPLKLFVDACDTGIGAHLQQITNMGSETLAYHSKKFSSSQMKYSTFDKELTAIYDSLKHFQHMIMGRKLQIFSDHKPLSFALQKRKDLLTARQATMIFEFYF